MRKKLLFILAIVFLSAMGYGLAITFAQEPTLTLDISVTNPSDKEAQEVEVKVDLPPELKEEDIVSSDGFKVSFDSEKGCFFVEGRVFLQSAETAIYNIVARDVWMIPEAEIEKLRLEMANSLSDFERPVLKDRLDNILKRQKDSLGNIGAHILAYRENKKEFSEIKNELQLISSGLEISKRRAQRVIRFILWVVILAGGIFFGLSKKQYLRAIIDKFRKNAILNRRRFVRVPVKAEIQYRLLSEGGFGPALGTNDISQIGISVNLDRPCQPYSTIELKVKLPAYVEILTLRGFVVWQKKVVSADKGEHYLTGVSFAEAAQQHYQILKDFIAAQIKA